MSHDVDRPAVADFTVKQTSGTIFISASASEIFALIANPHRHGEFDGSGTVGDGVKGPTELSLGDSFSLAMSYPLPIGSLPYRVTSKVVEFEADRLIAWCHFGKHRWRYELSPVDDGTAVTETFDWSTSAFPKGIEMAGYPERHTSNIDETLQRLAGLWTG